MTMRIAKFMARSGVCSRRDAEELIKQGRVTVDGEAVETPAFNVEGTEKILLDGEKLPQTETTRLWLYHKPAGLVTSHKDEKGRPTVFQHLPKQLPRVISVGRLDLNSEGLLLLTNNGELSRKLELPENGWRRRYKVRVYGDVRPERLAELQKGITVDGVAYGAVKAEIENRQGANAWLAVTLTEGKNRGQGANAWLAVTLTEGKNREIRKLMKHLGLEVSRLIRLSYGPFQLGNLVRGEIREIPHKVLKEQLGSKFVL